MIGEMRWLIGIGFVAALAVACGGVTETVPPTNTPAPPTSTPVLPPRQDGTPTAAPTAAPTANGVRVTVLGTMPFSAHDVTRSVFFVVVRFEPPLDDPANVGAELLSGETGELVGRLTPEDGTSAVLCVGSSGVGDVVFALRGQAVEDFASELFTVPGTATLPLQLRLALGGATGERLLLDLPHPTCFGIE